MPPGARSAGLGNESSKQWCETCRINPSDKILQDCIVHIRIHQYNEQIYILCIDWSQLISFYLVELDNDKRGQTLWRLRRLAGKSQACLPMIKTVSRNVSCFQLSNQPEIFPVTPCPPWLAFLLPAPRVTTYEAKSEDFVTTHSSEICVVILRNFNQDWSRRFLVFDTAGSLSISSFCKDFDILTS